MGGPFPVFGQIRRVHFGVDVAAFWFVFRVDVGTLWKLLRSLSGCSGSVNGMAFLLIW